ncbi:hypothetical protein [Frankia sp. AgB32]|uniref:hypothetical protein n=1 Tax=Frankia sp. AgB32 TaxID=631119 RepID=UPI00200D2FE6|nr:hypothetical protein [Frankia sp. AgB32]MCK9894302.1 hypothetical protein [Frankia sp. AgB32]
MDTSPDSDIRARTARPEHGIYGTVLTAGLIAAQDPLVESLADMVVDVLVTVAVFWLAHGYAHAVARPFGSDEGGEAAEPTRPLRPWGAARLAWASLMVSLPLARASIGPVAVLVLARLAGATLDDAQEIALWASVVLLALWGLRAGLAAGSTGWRLVRQTAGSALFGVVLVILETAIH